MDMLYITYLELPGGKEPRINAMPDFNEVAAFSRTLNDDLARCQLHVDFAAVPTAKVDPQRVRGAGGSMWVRVLCKTPTIPNASQQQEIVRRAVEAGIKAGVIVRRADQKKKG